MPLGLDNVGFAMQVAAGKDVNAAHCIWIDGVSRCHAFQAVAIINTACGVLDFAVVITFMLCGTVLEQGGPKRKRCAWLACPLTSPRVHALQAFVE